MHLTHKTFSEKITLSRLRQARKFGFLMFVILGVPDLVDQPCASISDFLAMANEGVSTFLAAALLYLLVLVINDTPDPQSETTLF